MADAAEVCETPVVEKVAAEEVDAIKKDVEEETASKENGSSAEEKKNGDVPESGAVSCQAVDDKDAAADNADNAEAENGEDGVDEANGDSTDSSPVKTVKRKVVDGESKTDESDAVTPEKKAKIEEAATKDEVQNGAEASVVAD